MKPTRVAVIGANGQVGAELCLMLAQLADIQLVPICRTRSGSAFLRWHGIACRHGRIADVADARRLLSDCTVIINSALATGTPAQIRNTEDAIVRNMIEQSPREAIIVHFSTQNVYGDPSPFRRVRWRSPYGRVKLATERQVRTGARRAGKQSFILRLGHVCGSLQEISAGIRADIHAGRVVLPAQDCSSNTVYTAAIVGAIEQIMQGQVPPGTYDMMNSPRWSWRAVYEHEAAICGVPFDPLVERPAAAAGTGRRLLTRGLHLAARLAAAGPTRNFAAKCFARIPERANAHAMAWWYRRRARSEIVALNAPARAPEHLSWVGNGRHFFPASMSTQELLGRLPRAAEAPPPGVSWAEDLPDADTED